MQRRGSEERISEAQLTAECVDESTILPTGTIWNEWSPEGRISMIISRVNDHWIPPLHLEYDKTKMLAMMTSISYAYLDGRHYKINIQNLLSSITRIHGEWYSQFLFGITDNVRGVMMWTMAWDAEKDVMTVQNNNAAKKRTWKKTGVTRVLAGYVWWTILFLNHLFVADWIKLQKDYKLTSILFLFYLMINF